MRHLAWSIPSVHNTRTGLSQRNGVDSQKASFQAPAIDHLATEGANLGVEVERGGGQMPAAKCGGNLTTPLKLGSCDGQLSGVVVNCGSHILDVPVTRNIADVGPVIAQSCELWGRACCICDCILQSKTIVTHGMIAGAGKLQVWEPRALPTTSKCAVLGPPTFGLEHVKQSGHIAGRKRPSRNVGHIDVAGCRDIPVRYVHHSQINMIVYT